MAARNPQNLLACLSGDSLDWSHTWPIAAILSRDKDQFLLRLKESFNVNGGAGVLSQLKFKPKQTICADLGAAFCIHAVTHHLRIRALGQTRGKGLHCCIGTMSPVCVVDVVDEVAGLHLELL